MDAARNLVCFAHYIPDLRDICNPAGDRLVPSQLCRLAVTYRKLPWEKRRLCCDVCVANASDATECQHFAFCRGRSHPGLGAGYQRSRFESRLEGV